MTPLEAAAHWAKLAEKEEKALAEGITDPVAGAYRAMTYRNCARACELTEEKGEPYCACHLIPSRVCRERQRGRA